MSDSVLFGKAINNPVVSTIRVDEIDPDPDQPRKHFDKKKIVELAESIKSQGLIQPIIVRSSENRRFMIVAGERRWRAMKHLGEENILAIVRNELNARPCSVIENLQRDDLTAVETANAINDLMDELDLSQGAVADLLGHGRSSVNQLLKIRSLPEKVQVSSVSLGTDKSILIELCKIKDEAILLKLWRKNEKEALSVADIKRVLEAMKKSGDEALKEIDKISKEEKSLRRAYDSVVSLRDKPLTEASRTRLMDLQAEIIKLLE